MILGLDAVLGDGGVVALPAALVAGVVAGLSPCCVAMYPAAAATCCAARTCEAPARRSLSARAALAFALGLAVATTILGVVAAAGGERLRALGGVLAYIVAIVFLAAGAQLLGWVRVPMPRVAPVRTGAFGAGLLLALVVAPCGTPLLASILSYAAYQGSLGYGAVLLFAYGIGLAVPVLVLGLSADRFARWLDGAGWRRWVDRVTGCVLVVLGLYVLWRA